MTKSNVGHAVVFVAQTQQDARFGFASKIKT